MGTPLTGTARPGTALPGTALPGTALVSSDGGAACSRSAVLRNAASGATALNTLHNSGYNRRLVANGGWPRLPSLGVLRPGDTTSVRSLGLLLARLHVEGSSG